MSKDSGTSESETHQCALCGRDTSHLRVLFKSEQEDKTAWLCEQDVDRLDRWWREKQDLRKQKQEVLDP